LWPSNTQPGMLLLWQCRPTRRRTRYVLKRVVLVHGPLRELVMDGAPELNGKVVEELVALLQARQTTPVPYRPALLGLVERFHRT